MYVLDKSWFRPLSIKGRASFNQSPYLMMEKWEKIKSPLYWLCVASVLVAGGGGGRVQV